MKHAYEIHATLASHSHEGENSMKCTVKNPPKNRAQTTFEGKKAQ
jgi:hypothetical protein